MTKRNSFDKIWKIREIEVVLVFNYNVKEYKFMKLATLIIIVFISSCKPDEKKCCNPDDLIISDIYHVQNNNQSRFICVNGIKGKVIESQYIYTHQLHKYKFENTTTEINYYHDLIEETMDTIQRSGFIESRIFPLSFGQLVVSVYSEDITATDNTAYHKLILDSIKVREFSDSIICFDCESVDRKIPYELIKIGVIKFIDYKFRKEIFIIGPNLDVRDQIDLQYSNIELLDKYLNDGDIITFLKNDRETILRSYIIVSSKIEELADLGWCGMGPIRFGFECIYVNNNHQIQKEVN